MLVRDSTVSGPQTFSNMKAGPCVGYCRAKNNCFSADNRLGTLVLPSLAAVNETRLPAQRQ